MRNQEPLRSQSSGQKIAQVLGWVLVFLFLVPYAAIAVLTAWLIFNLVVS
jgi:hypothetical protein